MGTKIFKIEEKMTEKMMPKVAYPPQQALRTHSCVLQIFVEDTQTTLKVCVLLNHSQVIEK